MNNHFDYYEVLGLSRDCTLNDIKKAFRKLALIYHPDKNQAGSKECEEKFKHIAEAYSILSDPKKRQKYDTYGASEFFGGAKTSGHGFNGKFGDFTYDRAEEIFKDFFKYEAPKMSKSNSYNPSQKSENKREGSTMFAQDDKLFGKDPFFSNAFGNFESKSIGEGYKGQANYRSFSYTIPSKPKAPGSKSVTTSTLIRNGKKIVVTQTTHHGENGSKRTEVHERVEEAGQNLHEHRYVNHHGMAQMAQIDYDPDQDRRN